MKKLTFAVFSLLFACRALATNQCQNLFIRVIEQNPELSWYENQRVRDLKPTADLSTFTPAQGIFVTKRNLSGDAQEVVIRILSPNPNDHLSIVGDFNLWKKSDAVAFKRDSDPSYMLATVKGMKHGDQFRILKNDKSILDPAALAFTSPEFSEKMYGKRQDYLNSVFWDIEGKGAYKHVNSAPDLREKAVAVSESELYSLVAKWRGGPKSLGETFNFIADSGIIEHLRKSGINAIEFLPLNAAVDNSGWVFRYQGYGMFAIDSRFGTPFEFARMVDKFNGAGIGFVMDVLFSHWQSRGNSGVRSLEDIGLAAWTHPDGSLLYGNEKTQWGTNRFAVDDPRIQRFLIDSVLNLIKYYRISGIRIDNYDGIRFLKGGTEFLKRFVSEIRRYAPHVWINAEMFLPENTVTKRLDDGGHGMNSYNNGNFFFNFVRGMAKLQTEHLDMNVISDLLREPWRWNEVMKLTYVTNHDEATNENGGGATGNYFATLVKGNDWKSVEGKTRAFGALAMLSGSFYLDMPQFRIMQEGNFGKNSDVEWSLLDYPSQKNMEQFFADMSTFFTTEPAFAPHNLHRNIENHVDNVNKVISLERIDKSTGKTVYILINLGHYTLSNYQFGINKPGRYKLVLNADSSKFGGTDNLERSLHGQDLQSGGPMHAKAASIDIPYVAPYSVVIIQN